MDDLEKRRAAFIAFQDRLGWNNSQWAKKAGVAEATIRNYRNGDTGSLTFDKAQKLASAANVTVSEMFGESDPALTQSDVEAGNIAIPEPQSVPSYYDLKSTPQDVPVYGTAAGALGEGSFTMDIGEPVDFVRRPPGIVGRPDVYAIFVIGVSMKPQFDHGDLVYVEPKAPTRIDVPVIVQIKNHEHAQIQAYIKLLVRRTGTTLYLKQHNPEAIIDVKKETVLAIHRVLPWNEVHGI